MSRPPISRTRIAIASRRSVPKMFQFPRDPSTLMSTLINEAELALRSARSSVP